MVKMKKNVVASLLGLTLVIAPGVVFAQLGGIGNPLGSSSSSSKSVSAEDLVKGFVNGYHHVASAQGNFLKAVGKKEQAEALEVQARNLTEAATDSQLEEAKKLQPEKSKELEASFTGGQVVLSAESKKQFALGLVDLTKGIRSYISMSSDASNFKPGLNSFGSAAGAAVFVVKNLPDSIVNLKNTLSNAVAFAKSNKIEVPKDATSLLGD